MNDRQLEYPATFKIAELASAAKKKYYSVSKAVEYSTVVLAALFAVTPADPDAKFHLPALFSGVSLLVALVVLFVERVLEYQNGWYETRALAEAVKAESWLFRCGWGDYSRAETDDDATAINVFLSVLDKLRTTTNAYKHTAGFTAEGDEVSQEMLATRRLPLSDRIDFFRSARIADQRDWYAAKAGTAKKWHTGFLFGAFASLLCGLVCAGLQAFGLLSGYSLVGFFSAFSAGLFAWIQMRRYEATSMTYTRASIELRAIGQLLANVDSESLFCQRVQDAEQVISREHEVWTQK